MDYKLIYVNKLGFNYRGHGTYEFLFCDKTIDLSEVWGEGWLEESANGNCDAPDIEYVQKVAVLTLKDYELDVAHDSIIFSMSDVKCNVTALAWEVIDDNFTPSMTRLVFQYGQSLESIEEVLSKRKLKLVYETD